MIKLVITRPLNRAKSTIELAQKMNFRPILFPLLDVCGIEDNSPEKPLTQYDWLLFTSSNAVEFFMQWCKLKKVKISGKTKIAAIGPGTDKTLAEYGKRADFVPDKFNRTSISEQIPVFTGDRILYPTLLGGPRRAENILSRRGCLVERIDVYKSEAIIYPQKRWSEMLEQKPDVFTFFSPKTVKAFYANEPQSADLMKYAVAALAKSSANELTKKGISARITAHIPTTENLLKNIQEYYA